MSNLTEQLKGFNVSSATLESVERIFKYAFEQAAESASMLVGRKMTIDQIYIHIKSGETFMSQVEDEFETCYFASIIKTMNDMNFNILFLISEREGVGLYHSLTGLSESSSMITSDMISAVGELNNILGSAFINSLANYLKTVIHATPPYNTYDMLGAVMECIVLQDEFMNKEFLCADATLREKDRDGFLVRLIIMSNKDHFIDVINRF
ncbi:chemotaxis protein CheC [bacterium]|nr:chemotaxis protein CheC [bacterium]